MQSLQTPTDSPFFLAVRCKNVSSRENGKTSAKEGIFEEVITLQCNTGHALDGPSSTNCTADGTWSTNLGYCRRPIYNGKGKGYDMI